jgi:hypothetical protein
MSKFRLCIYLSVFLGLYGCGSPKGSAENRAVKTDNWTLDPYLQVNPSGMDVKNGSYYRTSFLSADPGGKPIIAWTAAKNSNLYFQNIDPATGKISEPKAVFDVTGAWVDHPVIAVDSAKKMILLAAWHKRIEAPRTGDKHVYFTRSTDGGQTWKPPSILNRAVGAFSPTMAVDGKGAIYVVWKDERNGLSDLYFNRSNDYGETWLPEDIRLSPGTPGNGVSSSQVLLCQPGGRVYLAYSHMPDGSVASLYFRSSSDYGTTWTENIRVNDNVSLHMDFPSMAVQPDGRIALSWVFVGDRGFSSLYLDTSADDGRTWSADRIIYSSAPSAMEYLRSLKFPKDILNLVWVDMVGQEISVVYKTSKDFGATWGEQNKLDGRINPDVSFRRSVDLRLDTNSSDLAAAVWGEYYLGSSLIKTSYSMDQGASWLATPIEVSPEKKAESDYRFPQLAIFQNKVYLIYQRQQDNNTDLFFRQLTINGLPGDRNAPRIVK